MADALIIASVVIALVSAALALVRFVTGPTLLNRVVAFDTASIIVISVIAALAHLAGRYVYVDVALVYGLLGFLGVLVVARYREGGL